MKTKKKRGKFASKVWCIDGPCKDKVFVIQAGSKILKIITSEDVFYSHAIYTITERITRLSENVAIFVRGVER